jgi:hypothetical protein
MMAGQFRKKPESAAVKFKASKKLLDSSGSKIASKADASALDVLQQSCKRAIESGTSRHILMTALEVQRPTPSHTVAFPPVHCTHLRPLRHAHVRHVRVTRLCFALKPREIGPAGVQIDSPPGPCNDFWYVNCEHSHSLLAFLTFLSVPRLLSISTTSLCARSGSSSNLCIWGAWQEAKSAIMARPTRSSGRKPNCTDCKHTQIIRTVKGWSEEHR